MRKRRLRNILRQSGHRASGLTRESKACSPPKLTQQGSVGDSPRNRRRHGSDQYDIPSFEGNLFDFLRESSDSVKQRSIGSCKRRRSFEGRLLNRDFVNANGILCRNNSENTAHQFKHTKLEKDDTAVPCIVVDSPIERTQEPFSFEAPSENDSLLDKSSDSAAETYPPTDPYCIPLQGLNQDKSNVKYSMSDSVF